MESPRGSISVPTFLMPTVSGARRSADPYVPVRCVEVLVRERGRRRREQELARAPDGARGLLVREDAEVGDKRRLLVARERRECVL